jgi:hypothetical protein
MSFGPTGSSLKAMMTVIPKVVSGLTRGLSKVDLAANWAALAAYGVPQAAPRPPG